jgi:hypothetical protein
MIRAAFAALAVSVLAAACGTQAPLKCQPSNCSGCCSADGECLGASAQSKQACGSQGADCRACLPDQLCSTGRCVRDPDAGTTGFGGGTGGGGDVGGGAGGGSGGGGAGGGSGGGSGGGGGAPCGQQGQACCANAMCFLSLTCDRGLCQPASTTDAGTPDAGTPDAGQTLRLTGEPCTADGQCLDGACLQSGFTGGYCTRGCTVATDCLAGSQCGNNPGLQGPTRICLKQCASPGQSPGGCRTSYVCEANVGTSGVPVCYPRCSSSTQCGTAPTCDTRGFCCGIAGFACCEGTMCEAGNACMNGNCVTSAACGNAGQACCTTGTACLGQTVCRSNVCTACGGDGQPCCASDVCSVGSCQSGTCVAQNLSPFGGPCTTLADCQTNSCIQSNGTLWSGGYCSQTCTDTDSSTCPSGASCSRYVAAPNQLCLENCAWDGGAGGCRTGYVCDRNLIAGSTQATCFTRCTSAADCGGSRQCQNGFCCGSPGFRCCTGTPCPLGGSCNAQGYCQ